MDLEGTEANGYAVRDAALLMVQRSRRRRKSLKTVGADKGCDSGDFLLPVLSVVLPASAGQASEVATDEGRSTGGHSPRSTSTRGGS